MQYGICLLSVVPCRKEATNTSEMVTQLLFGDHYSILETVEGWIKIKIAYDQYECWINLKQHSKITETAFNMLQNHAPVCSTDLVQVITNKQTNVNFPISIGSALPFLKDKSLSIDSYEFGFDGQTSLQNVKKSAKDIISTAYLLINAPYLWGGKNPLGIDCSGFTQIVYKLNGYKLPRDASQQVELGSALSFVEEAEAGDLAFFDNEEGNIVHVGILLDNQQIIHASGSVRIDKFDHYGIFSSDRKKYSHTLRVIKKII